VGAINIWLRAFEAYVGTPGSPQRAPAVRDEARRSGGTIDKEMKKAVRAVHNQTNYQT